MPRPEIKGGSNLGRVDSELMRGQKGPAQGPVDHFEIKPGSRTGEQPKITKVFQAGVRKQVI